MVSAAPGEGSGTPMPQGPGGSSAPEYANPANWVASPSREASGGGGGPSGPLVVVDAYAPFEAHLRLEPSSTPSGSGGGSSATAGSMPPPPTVQSWDVSLVRMRGSAWRLQAFHGAFEVRS